MSQVSRNLRRKGCFIPNSFVKIFDQILSSQFMGWLNPNLYFIYLFLLVNLKVYEVKFPTQNKANFINMI